MKSRFSTIDIKATLAELQRFLGMRVANVYDVDNKTYLIKLARPDHKAVLLLESGVRIHSTDFEWPKNINPSGFAMKMRKHLRTRRLEKIEQLGIDRIIDIQFGSGEAAYHIILELYDRGNIVLTDFEYTILNILRPRTDDSQDVKLTVRETYPLENARQHQRVPSQDEVKKMFASAKEGDNLKKILNPQLVYGPAVLEHCLLKSGLPDNARFGKEFNLEDDIERLYNSIQEAEKLLQTAGTSKGYIIQKSERKAAVDNGEPEVLLTYQEFHPYLFKQHEKSQHVEFDSFDKAVDEFFSKMESQKIDVKVLQQEKSALKKLENVKHDHEKRLNALHKNQETDQNKGKLIEMNLPLVDKAITIVQSALANQIDWSEISQIVKEAQAQGDAVASTIKGLKLDSNHIVMLLSDPYADSDDEDDDDIIKPLKVDVDLGLTAYANARKYFDKKRVALKKEQKTLDASGKALKSAEKKTKQTLKEVATTASINKMRKTYWFEKFLWFISSENYLVIGGRDQQQNELIVKRYLKAGDLYVHADLHGASSVLIKNPTGEPIPPKTLNEAGTMAVCNSAAWDARVVTSAWWVYHDQVSKTAPSGEYLTTGSFMVRGKKNYLPPCYLVYGFGFLFKLDESSVFKHKGERRVRSLEEDAMSVTDSVASELSLETTEDVDSGSDSSDEEEGETKNEQDDEMDTIPEEKEAEMSAERTSECDNMEEVAVKHSQIQSEKGHVDSLDSEHSRKSEQSTVNDEVGATASESVDSATSFKVQDNVKGGTEEPTAKSDSSEDEALFPDTSIQLQHVKGGKFELQRSVSSSSGKASEDPVSEQSTDPATAGSKRLSAKQRRLLKKQKGKQIEESKLDQVAEAQSPNSESESQMAADHQPTKSTDEKVPAPQPPAGKRGQKAKVKKIKDKYGDQDEEERDLKMKILASSGTPKENPKKTKKAKQQQQKVQQQQKQKDMKQQRANWRLTAEDIKQETPTISMTTGSIKAEEEKDVSDEEKQDILEQENLQTAEDADILDSLTGIPDVEDLLLFSVPVCAPYSVLTNYKYKVKLTPGTTKRGKAAKLALHTFLNDKTTTQREKDLLKSVKDVDLSRYMPGKVKVSAPNLQKAKSKH